MEELRNLNQIYSLASGRFNQYEGKDFVLPRIFKEQVTEINSNTITYNEYSAVIETRGNQNGVLSIYLPNQWFYIASYFTDFYNELQRYKKEALKVVSKERLKDLNGSSLTEQEESRLQSLSLTDQSKLYLRRFMTDYSWWFGAKTIDRGDFYVSPILNSARLVNASQSFVADLCAFLANKKDLVQAIISGEEASFKKNNLSNSFSLQQIFYGAPGTGKSKTIKDQTIQGEKEGRVFRITFHPDSDYSTFVGCYKPGMKSGDRMYSAEELAVKLKEIKNSGVTYPCHKFAAQYWRSLKDLSADAIKQILNACGFTESMNVEVSKGVAIGQEYLNKDDDGKIVYTFTPQAFTNAYVKAWSTTEDVYLIIEEINRGNCAQIFGDLFQLLDRGDNGLSEYPIEADTDLGNYIAKELENSTRSDFPNGVKEGEKLILPSNLYIWATMNTSDQSLFPIDSAFKRRWDWQYVPIHDGGKGWQIKADGKRYDWWQFVDAMNDKIGTATYSEDKKLGYFFCKAKDGAIDAETFVGKVVFYIWNDVFKDFAEEAGNLFKDVDGSMLSFNKFYTIGTDGKRMVVEPKIAILMQNLGVEPMTTSNSANEEVAGDVEEEMQNDIFGNQRKESLISISIPNHPIIKSSDSTQFDAFIKALKIIGFERIKNVAPNLKYKRLGNIPVISTQRNEIIDNNNQGYSYYEEGGLFIIKGCKYYTYIRILEDLNSMLNIGLSMETK